MKDTSGISVSAPAGTSRLVLAVTVILISCLGTTELLADQIILKNGQVINGKVRRQSRTSIWIQTQSGQRQISKKQIRRLRFGDVQPRPDPAEAKRKAEQERRRQAELEARQKEQQQKEVPAERVKKEAQATSVQSEQMQKDLAALRAERAELEKLRQAIDASSLPVLIVLKSEQEIEGQILGRQDDHTLLCKTRAGVIRIDVEDVEEIRILPGKLLKALPEKSLKNSLGMSGGQYVAALAVEREPGNHPAETVFQSDFGLLKLEQDDLRKKKKLDKKQLRMAAVKRKQMLRSIQPNKKMLLHLYGGHTLAGLVVHTNADDVTINTNSGRFIIAKQQIVAAEAA